MKQRTVNATLVVTNVSKIVGESGFDYLYKENFTKCENFSFPKTHTGPRYDIDRVPACIVGQFFHSIGVKYQECGNATAEASVRMLQKSRPDLRFTDTAVLMLASMQAVQDAGGTWGLAKTAGFRIYEASQEFFNRDHVAER